MIQKPTRIVFERQSWIGFDEGGLLGSWPIERRPGSYAEGTHERLANGIRAREGDLSEAGSLESETLVTPRYGPLHSGVGALLNFNGAAKAVYLFTKRHLTKHRHGLVLCCVEPAQVARFTHNVHYIVSCLSSVSTAWPLISSNPT